MPIPYQPTWTTPYSATTLFPQTQPMPQQQAMPQPFNGIIKVAGRESAMAYNLPPNSTSPALFDNNGKTFYIKTTDGAGVGTVEAFDYVEHVDMQPVPVAYVSREEFDTLASKVDALVEGKHVEVPATVPADPVKSDDGNAVTGERISRK